MEEHKIHAFLHDLGQLTRQYGIKFRGHLEPALSTDGAYLLSTTDFSSAFISWCEGEKQITDSQQKRKHMTIRILESSSHFPKGTPEYDAMPQIIAALKTTEDAISSEYPNISVKFLLSTVNYDDERGVSVEIRIYEGNKSGVAPEKGGD